MHWHEGSLDLQSNRACLLADAIASIKAVNHTNHHIPGIPASTQHPPATSCSQRRNPVLLQTSIKQGPCQGTRLCQPHVTRAAGGLFTHLPRWCISWGSTSTLLVPSALVTSLTSHSQPSSHPLKGGAGHWTLKRQSIVLVPQEAIKRHLLLQKYLKVFYRVNSRSVERMCGVDYSDPFRALTIFK